jgi:hypothetical protein
VRGGKKIPGYAESVRRIRLKKSNWGYAEGSPRRSSNAVTAPSRAHGLAFEGRVPRPTSTPRIAPTGRRRHSVAYAEGITMPTTLFRGWLGWPIRGRPQLLMVGVCADRRRLAPFL